MTLNGNSPAVSRVGRTHFLWLIFRTIPTIQGGPSVEVPDPMNRPARWLRQGAACLALILAPTAAIAAGPDDPAWAPDYPHKSFRAENFGSGPRSYWLFEPIEPRPRKAPVVAF